MRRKGSKGGKERRLKRWRLCKEEGKKLRKDIMKKLKWEKNENEDGIMERTGKRGLYGEEAQKERLKMRKGEGRGGLGS